MAKYYVQSGTLKMVVHADDADRAALWAVHQVLAQVLPVFDDADLTAQEKQIAASFQGMLALDEEVLLSEQGYDRADAVTFPTTDLVREWGQLVVALQKIDELMVAEGRDEDLCLAI